MFNNIVPDIAEDRLDSLLKNLNKDTPLINSNINESNSVDVINKTDGTLYFSNQYSYIKLILTNNISLDFGKNQNHSTSLLNNRTVSFNNTPKPIPKEHLKCNILKGNILIFLIKYN